MRQATETKETRTGGAVCVSPDCDITREAVYIPTGKAGSKPQFLDSREPNAAHIRVTFPARGEIPKQAARRFRNFDFTGGEAVITFYGKLKRKAV